MGAGSKLFTHSSIDKEDDLSHLMVCSFITFPAAIFKIVQDWKFETQDVDCTISRCLLTTDSV